jgi:glucose/arabinose dehydrogenase
VLRCCVRWSARPGHNKATDAPARVNTFKPAKAEATATRLAALKAPAGFKVTVLTRDLQNLRMLVVAPNGNIYASRREQGDVLMLKDANEDGVLDQLPQRWRTGPACTAWPSTPISFTWPPRPRYSARRSGRMERWVRSSGSSTI